VGHQCGTNPFAAVLGSHGDHGEIAIAKPIRNGACEAYDFRAGQGNGGTLRVAHERGEALPISDTMRPAVSHKELANCLDLRRLKVEYAHGPQRLEGT